MSTAEPESPPAAEVLYDVTDRVATVTLNRPHRRNAISARMLAQLSSALRDADADPDVRCVLLTGAGKGFCSGLDLKDATAGTGIGSAARRTSRAAWNRAVRLSFATPDASDPDPAATRRRSAGRGNGNARPRCRPRAGPALRRPRAAVGS